MRKILLAWFLSLCLFLPERAFSQTDACASAPVLTPGSTCVTTAYNMPTTFTASSPTITPTCATGSAGVDDGWYQFVAAGPESTVTATVNSAFTGGDDLILQVFSGTCGALTSLGCADATGASTLISSVTETISFPTTAGSTYWIRLLNKTNATAMPGTVCVISVPPAVNDDPCGALTLSVGTTCAATTYSMPVATFTAGTPATACSGTSVSTMDDGWYSFTATGTSTTITGTATGSGDDLMLAVYSGTCAALSEVACVNATGGASLFGGVTETTTISTTVGATYWVRIINYAGGGALDGTICAFSVPTTTAPNDNPCGAISLPVGATCSYTSIDFSAATNTASSLGLPAPGCGGWTSGTPDLWYAVTVPASGNIAVGGTAGSFTDGAIALYQGDCAASLFSPLNLIECVDDVGASVDPLVYGVGLAPGSTVYIRVWDELSSNGTYNICAWNPGSDVPTTPQDCAGAILICTDATFNGNSAGDGLEELGGGSGASAGCLTTGERQSSWYYFTLATGGTIGFTIDPVQDTDDYDFAIWQDPSCPMDGAPTRCSYSSLGGNTGLVSSAGDNTEDASGDKWVNTITAPAGTTFYMCIDNYSTSNQPFDLSWSFSGGASLACETPLAVTLLEFSSIVRTEEILLRWKVASSAEIAHFEIERSEDGQHFESIGSLEATLGDEAYYEFADKNPLSSSSYYRLKTTEKSGEISLSFPILVQPAKSDWVRIYPNPVKDQLSISFFSLDAEQIHLEIRSLEGELVHKSSSESMMGKNEITLSTENLKPGMYLISTVHGTRKMFQKLIKQ